jgi:GAF domain-containing protein
MKLLADLIPSEAASACLYDINTDEFRFVALRGPGAEQRKGEAVPRETGLMGASVRKVGVALRVNDVSSDERFDPGVDGRVDLEARNILYMPLNHEGRLLGILQLINRKIVHEFTTADLDVIAYVGKQTGEFLHQAKIALKPHAGTG